MGNDAVDRPKLLLAGLVAGCVLTFGPMALFGTPNTLACFTLGLLNVPFMTAMVMWAGGQAVPIDPSGTVGALSKKRSGGSYEHTNGRSVAGRTYTARRGSSVRSGSVY